MLSEVEKKPPSSFDDFLRDLLRNLLPYFVGSNQISLATKSRTLPPGSWRVHVTSVAKPDAGEVMVGVPMATLFATGQLTAPTPMTAVFSSFNLWEVGFPSVQPEPTDVEIEVLYRDATGIVKPKKASGTLQQV